ncbi:MAG: hypothetical protein RBR81_06535 [Bacteroidales bacterium]|jgi:hypothetical protein|nr:hypothetical protein [Bacteroidales bacterium]
MNTRKLIAGTEVFIGTILITLITYGMYLRFFVGSEEFVRFVREDGPVEYLTAFFLFFCSLVCLYRVTKYCKPWKKPWVITWILLAILFFFAAGDEISWGQRIFNIESGDFFKQHNKQSETNLHNLVVKGHSLNKVIFSRFMFAALIIYFMFSRIMTSKIRFIRKMVVKYRIPLPEKHHIILMVAATLMILTLQMTKDSELHELSFALVFFLIFLNPAEINDDGSSQDVTPLKN